MLLWGQRQRQSSSVIRWWQRQQRRQVGGARATGRCGWVREVFRRLTWRETCSSRGFVSLLGRKGREGKKREELATAAGAEAEASTGGVVAAAAT